MSTNRMPNISKAIDRGLNEDSVMSSSTSNNSFNDTLIQDLSKLKNKYLISKSIEQKIIEILSYLQSDTNLASNKIIILKYLQTLFTKVEFNSEIFLRKFINDKEKLNLYKIIIYQYVLYTNPGNSKTEEENYRSELLSLFVALLTQVTVEKETYHYILSFLIYFMNEKYINNSLDKKNNPNNNDIQDDNPIINITSEHLLRVLQLLRNFYKYIDPYYEVYNYFFFSGESDSSIIIQNKDNPKEYNRKILNLDDTLCIMMFIKLLPSEFIKAVYPKVIFRILELRFIDTKKTININIDIDNKLTTSFTTEPIFQLAENETNCVLVKLKSNKKKKVINCEIFIGTNKAGQWLFSNENEKDGKPKDEIKEIVLFKNFIGTCSNILIYKEKKNDGLPKFLLSLEENNSSNKKANLSIKSMFFNGIFTEELYSYFTKAELKEQIESNILDNIIKINEEKVNINDIRDFLNNSLISIYMPTRVDIPSKNEEKSLINSYHLILRDSINNLDADFTTKNSGLNGVHTFSKIKDDFSIIGGINSLLPIIELMTNNTDLLSPENFSSFFSLISNYIFSPNYQKAIIKENKSNFFMSLSLFLEKISDNYFDSKLCGNFKSIVSFLNNGNDNSELNREFHNHILLNEKILFKFNDEQQKIIINQIRMTIEEKSFSINIIKIIKILLKYDTNKNYKFCCKKHKEYFNDNYEVVDKELSSRIEPLEKLIEVIFDKYKLKQEKIEIEENNNYNSINSHSRNKSHSNRSLIALQKKVDKKDNLYFLFYLLTFDISPCLQKSIICLLSHLIEKYKYENFVKYLDKKEELFNIALFVFKTSIFDVKVCALNLLLLIEKNNGGKNLKKKIIFNDDILPIFLIDEINISSNIDKDEEKGILTKNENDKKEDGKNDGDITPGDKKIEDKETILKETKENEEQNKTNIDKDNLEPLKNDIENKKTELENEINKDETPKIESSYEIKPYIEIDGVKYNLYSPTEIQKIISKKYNKKKLLLLINDLYENIMNYFNDNICLNLKLNLLIELVSHGNLLLIKSFISKISLLKEEQEKDKKEYITNELINNEKLFQWLLETSFQINILKKDKDKTFKPGFSMDIFKNDGACDESAEPYSDQEKQKILDNISKKCQEIMFFILNNNISKLDYLLTLGKYYLELKDFNQNFNMISELVKEIIYSLLSSPLIKTFSENNFTEIERKTTLYYYNIFFELFTYYKLKYSTTFFKEEIEFKINRIESDFRYILFNKREEGIKFDSIKELEKYDDKIEDYNILRTIFTSYKPIWTLDDKKLVQNEDEIYSKYIAGVNNSHIQKLELLFYNYEDNFLKNKDNCCNKGIPLIIIIYHFFICFLNIGGDKGELIEYFSDLRLFILLLIISSSTLNSAEIKKKKWPKEDQYNQVQLTIEELLFNFLFYLYQRIKQFEKKINEYNLKVKNLTENKTLEAKVTLEYYNKNLDCLFKSNRVYKENLGYILKVINIIYRGVNDEKQAKSKFSNWIKKFRFHNEGIKKSATFLLIDKLYNECPNLNLNEINNNNFRKTVNETQRQKIDIEDKNNEKDKEEEDNNKKDIKKYRNEHGITSNLENYLTNPNPETPLSLNLKKNSKSQEIKAVQDDNNNDNRISSREENNSNKIINDLSSKNHKDNYLDEICKISFTGKDEKDKNRDAREINLDDNEFKKLEKYLNLFLNDRDIEKFYQKHYDDYNKDLYPFISIIEQRQSQSEKIIPIYENTKNISSYPNNICLVPYYYPENKYTKDLIKEMGEKNKALCEEIKIKQKEKDIEENFKFQSYKDIKKDLFKFNGIWSNEEVFYDIDKYKLKYKILNHMTNDFTRIFMTPILDIDYYLPNFSMFTGNIFRETNENLTIPITKVTDLCFGLKKKPKEITNNNNTPKTDNNKENNKTENKLESSANSHISFDSMNNSPTSNLSETKQDIANNSNSDKIKIPLYDLNQENYPFLKEDNIKEINDSNSTQIVNNFNEKDFNIFLKYIKRKHCSKIDEEHCLYAEACLVKLPFHIRGIIYINDKEIGFYSYETKRLGKEEDYDNDKKVCFGSVFKEKSDKYNRYFMSIPLSHIELVFKRRYYFKRNVLEIFTQKKRSYFFRIDENKFKSFLDILKFQMKNDLEDITIDYTRYEERIGLVNKNNILYNYNNYSTLFNTRRNSIKTLYTKWIRWEVSTFTLLNVMNIYSNRSYNDINQYPVFPWIITNYTDYTLPSFENPNIINNKNANNNTNNNNVNTPNPNSPEKKIPLMRPFNTPMGMLELTPESIERKENYQEHWLSLENDDDKDENYDRYGSHYSTSLYLTYYLVRVFPFSYIRIELQGKKFDDPNRLFNSLSNSFECAITQKSDLRELIPEFFCFPELFYNSNDLNLGQIVDEKTKSPKLVNDIEMPPWAKGDAYIFVGKHRELLESAEISEKINEWFNIIFGSKQKGKIAKSIGNLFIRQTYEDFDDIHKNADENEKIYQMRMVEFGVTPSQILKNDANKRISYKDLKKKTILYNYHKTYNSKGNYKEELEIKDLEFQLEGAPYKIFSSLKKNEEVKNEKILFLYQDKIKIISKTNEKGFFQKSKSKESRKNKNPKEKDVKFKDNKNKESKESNEHKENEENKETDKINDENANKINIEENDDNNSDEESEIKDDEDAKNLNNKETISKYDKILISPKYRMNLNDAPTIIYDKANYVAQGGFWNGHILINKLEDTPINKKDKSQKNINIISTKELSPITQMKIDLSETFVICSNKKGIIYIFIINPTNKGEWALKKVIQDNQKEISCLDLNENLNIFVTCDKEGYINLYTFPECKLFNSYKLNESTFPTNINMSDISISTTMPMNIIQNNIYVDNVIISQTPLPCLIFYIKSRKSLLVFSINFHFIKETKLGYEIAPNGIKKYSDYFSEDFLFIYNSNEKVIDVYNIMDLNIIAKSKKINYTFVDFHFSKEMDHALIMVKTNEDKKAENQKDKNDQINHKILVLTSPGRGEVGLF